MVFFLKHLVLLMFFIFLCGCSNEMNSNQFDQKLISNENNNYNYQENNNHQKNNQLNNKKILDVPIINQNPELKFGCEVTSLAMVLHYANLDIDKMTLADQLAKDNTKIIKSKNGDILKWGNPDLGFVGDMTGKEDGYAVFDKPLEELMSNYLGDRTINLTGKDFDYLIKQIDKDKPVIIWTTGDYNLPDRWESWKYGNKTIKTPLDLHVVVLVGYDKENVYINDPLTGEKSKKVDKKKFITSWEALKKRAISYN